MPAINQMWLLFASNSDLVIAGLVLALLLAVFVFAGQEHRKYMAILGSQEEYWRRFYREDVVHVPPTPGEKDRPLGQNRGGPR